MKMLCNVKLSPHRYKTPEGYLYCQDAILARTGKQTYLKSEIYGISDDEDIYIDVDRNENEVFSEKTLASFEGKPLTIEHPDVNVGPENYKELSVGHIQNVRRGNYEGQPVMLADIVVNDAEAISLIESGEMVELSCGYDCDITDGPNPEQVNIRGNHVALCEQGRAGIARIQDSKKEKEGWVHPIIKDTVGRGSYIQEFGRYGEQYKVLKVDGNVLYCEEVITKKNTLFKKDKENIDWAVIKKSQVNDSINYDIYDIVLETDRCWDFTLNKLEKDIQNKYGYELSEVREKADRNERMLQCIILGYGNVGETQVSKMSIGPFNDEKDVKEFLPELRKLIDKNKSTSRENITFKVEKKTHSTKDAKEEFAPNEYSDEFTAEELDEFVRKQYRESNNKDQRERKKKVFVNKKEKEDFIKSLPESAEVRSDEFDNVFPDDRYLVYWEVYYWADQVKDSVEHYVIALKEDNDHPVWLDENDKPTEDYKLAKRFNSREEADSHQQTYCKGSVCRVNDALNIPTVKIELEEILKNIPHDKIDDSWGSITIDFKDKKDLRKAGKLLSKKYDIELFDDDENELYIAVYDKLDKENIKDSEHWGGYNLRRGKPAQDFKQYLRDRGMYFEPSENGEFIHFEVKNPDEDVIKEIKAINEHYTKVGVYDEYSRRFYSKAIKALNDKLEKLNKNQLLDMNQEDYQIQKDKMIKEIKKQIAEYQKKMDELD